MRLFWKRSRKRKKSEMKRRRNGGIVPTDIRYH
jgi:hypothetical protein